MKRVLACVASFGLGCWALPPATADESDPLVFSHGNWYGYRIVNEADGGCYVQGFFSNDIYLGIVLYDNYAVSMFLSSDRWNLPENSTYPVEYWVDGGYRYDATANVYDKRSVDIDIAEDFDVYRMLQDGRELTVRTQGRDFHFGLGGSRTALTKALQCVQENIAASQPTTDNPFAAGAASQSGGDIADYVLAQPTTSTSELAEFIANQIDMDPAGIRVVPNPHAAPSDWWHYTIEVPGGYGFYWEEDLRGRSVREIATGWLADMQRECTSDVVTAVKKDASGPRGAHAAGIISCKGSDNDQFYAATLNALVLTDDPRRQEGLAILLLSFVDHTHARSEGGEPGDPLGTALAEFSSDYVQQPR